MSYIINRQDVCMCDAMPFSQHWEARVVGPIDKIDMSAALQIVYDVLRPGDKIEVCAFVKNDWAQLIEIASFRVASRIDRRLNIVLVSEISKVSRAQVVAEVQQRNTLKVVKSGNAFEVQDEAGHTLDAFVTEAQALEYIKNVPKEEVPAAAKDDRSKWTIGRGYQGRHVVKNENGELVKDFRRREAAEAFLKGEAEEAISKLEAA